MTRSPLVSVSVCFAAFGASIAFAAETSPILLQPAPPTPAAAAASAPFTRRVVSPEGSAKLAAALPKFDATLAPSKPIEPGTDLREVDKPRNTIIRLPNYIVQEEKPVLLKERELLTPPARLDLALKKYPGLRLGSFWIFRNDGIALAMLAEEERLERKREFEDLVGLMQLSAPAAKAEVKRQVDDAFTRKADFGR